jgi:hypothetical protein
MNENGRREGAQSSTPAKRYPEDTATGGLSRGCWTAADDAELDALLWALVEGYFEHRERCRACLEAVEPCPSLRRAIAEVLAWRQARVLLSRAQALRAQLEAAA